jgi:hypothetical protein
MATKTWNQTSGNLASTDANWVGGAKPIAGDDVVLDGTSTANMTQDLALTFGSYSQNAGYTGTVTQTASFGTTGAINLLAGTFNASSTKNVTCGGAFTKNGGLMNSAFLNLIMTGPTISIDNDVIVNSLVINESVTLSATGGAFYVQVGPITVASGKTLTVNANFNWRAYNSGVFTNNGTINGTGSFLLYAYNGSDNTIILGTINCPVSFQNIGLAASTIRLGADTVLGSTLNVLGATGFPMVLHHGTNYTLTVAALVTILAAGTMIQGTDRWTFAAFTQSGASSIFTQGGYLIVNGTATISNGTGWSVNENATVDALSQSGGVITVATGKVLYYEKTLSQTGGSSSGTIAQFQARKQPPNQPPARRPVDVTNL